MASAVTEILQYIVSVIGPAAGDPRTAASVRTPLGQLASRTKWLRYFQQLLHGAELTVSAVDTSADKLTVTGHSLGANTAVGVFAANGGTLPGGLSADTVYYVDVVDADTIKLSASSGPGAAVDLTAGFSGDVYIAAIPDWISSMLVANTTYGAGKLKDLVMWLAGAQTITGAKTFDDFTLSGTSAVKYASRSVSRGCAGAWRLASDDTVHVYKVGIPASDEAVAVLDLPHGQTLTALTAYINPTDTGSLPGTMPVVTVIKMAIATGAESSVGSATDSSASAVAYSATHAVTISGLSHVIDRDAYKYVVNVAGENVNSIVVNDVRATCTVTSEKRWA